MSSYVKSTNFASKDSLATGNPLKIVKGTEIDTEFNNIATAVATKADLNSPAFLGTPTAPTASSGTSSTQIATTAFVATAMALAYPVGSIYINASVATNPGTLLGFGTWEAFGSGKVLVGLDSSDTLFDTLGETGGSKDAVAVTHTHTATSTSTVTDPSHTHGDLGVNSDSGSPYGGLDNGYGGSNYRTIDSATTGITVATSTTVNSAGESGTNKNIQPYIVVHMWKRTA